MSFAATPWSGELQRRWHALAQETIWAFPSDWDDPAVEAVCEALCDGTDFYPAAERLGRARAAGGVSLGETLADVDILAGLVDRTVAEPLRRAVSLGWADGVQAPPVTVSDPLTGLVTREYLKVRLSEVYQEAEVAGGHVPVTHALVVVRLDGAVEHWCRGLPMIMAAETMRSVFDGGRTHVQLGRGVAAVLTRRDDVLARRARLLYAMLSGSSGLDGAGPPSVWIETLPPTYRAALDLIGELGR